MKHEIQYLHEVHIAEVKDRLNQEYPDRWQGILDEWRNPPHSLMFWLLYHAHYLFSTCGISWAVDPALPFNLNSDLKDHQLSLEELKKLDFILLTHAHADHLDIPLLRFLRDTSVRFIVPRHMFAMIRQRIDPCTDQLTVAQPYVPISCGGIKIHPFPGLHRAREVDGQLRGCDCTGYLVEVAGQRWLFPVDVREYNVSAIAEWKPVDVLFAHLWLGRGQAAAVDTMLLDKFCDFVLACQPRTVVIGHLYSFQHPLTDTWTERHAQMVCEQLRSRDSAIRLIVPAVGEGIGLQA